MNKYLLSIHVGLQHLIQTHTQTSDTQNFYRFTILPLLMKTY